MAQDIHSQEPLETNPPYPRQYYMSTNWTGDLESPEPLELKKGGMSMKGTMNDAWAYGTPSSKESEIPRISGVRM